MENFVLLLSMSIAFNIAFNTMAVSLDRWHAIHFPLSMNSSTASNDGSPPIVNNEIFIQILLNAKNRNGSTIRDESDRDNNAPLGSKANPIVVSQEFDPNAFKSITYQDEKSHIAEPKSNMATVMNMFIPPRSRSYQGPSSQNSDSALIPDQNRHNSAEELSDAEEFSHADLEKEIAEGLSALVDEMASKNSPTSAGNSNGDKGTVQDLNGELQSVTGSTVSSCGDRNLLVTMATRTTSARPKPLSSKLTLPQNLVTTTVSQWQSDKSAGISISTYTNSSPNSHHIALAKPHAVTDATLEATTEMTTLETESPNDTPFMFTLTDNEMFALPDQASGGKIQSNHLWPNDLIHSNSNLTSHEFHGVEHTIPLQTATQDHSKVGGMTSLPTQAKNELQADSSGALKRQECADAVAPLEYEEKTDVLFLIDSSDKMGNEKFTRAVKLIADTVKEFNNIGLNGIQFALVQFTEKLYLKFPFNAHTCKSTLLEDIYATKFMNGVRNLNITLDRITKEAFTNDNGARSDAKNVLVLVSDGANNNKIQQPVKLKELDTVDLVVVITVEHRPELIMHLTEPDIGNMELKDRQLTLAMRLATKIRQISEEEAQSNFEKETEKVLEKILNSSLESDNASPSVVQTTGTAVDMIKGRRTTSSTEEPTFRTSLGTRDNLAFTETQTVETSTSYKPETTVLLETMLSTAEVTTQGAPVNQPQWNESAEHSTNVHPDDSRLIHFNTGDLKLKCADETVEIDLKVPSEYQGFLTIGTRETENCTIEVSRYKYELVDGDFHFKYVVNSEDCPINRVESVEPPGLNVSGIVRIHQSRILITGNDENFFVHCFYPKVKETLNVNLDISSEKDYGETIALEATPPKCTYTIRRDSPNGPLTSSARVGETLYHDWKCMGESAIDSVYGMLIKNCKAHSFGGYNYSVVDETGCSIDKNLFEHPVYDNTLLSASARSNAFTFVNTNHLGITCEISLCTKKFNGCKQISPPVCGRSNKMAHDTSASIESLTAALTSDVTADVEILLSSQLSSADDISDVDTYRWKQIGIAQWIFPILWIIAITGTSAVLILFSVRYMRAWSQEHDVQSCSSNGPLSHYEINHIRRQLLLGNHVSPTVMSCAIDTDSRILCKSEAEHGNVHQLGAIDISSCHETVLAVPAFVLDEDGNMNHSPTSFVN